MISGLNPRMAPSALVSKIDRPVALEGGTERIINGRRYHVITSSTRIRVISGGLVYALIVAAGGSRASNGGGGGGGLADYLPISVTTGSILNVTIGAAVGGANGGDTEVQCLRPARLTGGGRSASDGGSGGGANSSGGTRGRGDTPRFFPRQGFDGSAYCYVGGGGGGYAVEPTNTSFAGKDGGAGLSLDTDTRALGSLILNATHFSSGGGGNGDVMFGGTTGGGGPGAGVGGYGANNTSATWYGCGAGGGSLATVGFQGIVIIRYPV